MSSPFSVKDGQMFQDIYEPTYVLLETDRVYSLNNWDNLLGDVVFRLVTGDNRACRMGSSCRVAPAVCTDGPERMELYIDGQLVATSDGYYERSPYVSSFFFFFRINPVTR